MLQSIDSGIAFIKDLLFHTVLKTLIMQCINGAWKAIPFTENGSYLIIEAPSLENGTAAFCVSGSAASPAVIITAAAIAAAMILAVTAILILIRKNKYGKAKTS